MDELREQLKLSTGDHLVVRGGGDAPREVVVVQVKYGLIWISGSTRPGEVEELVDVECSVENDARYRAPARVVFVPPETYALRRVGVWERFQRRSDVRVRTLGVPIELVNPFEVDGVGPLSMLDISAGGLAARGGKQLEVGEQVRCSFRLPEVGAFEVGAKVVRIIQAGTPQRPPLVAFQFSDLAYEQRTRLLRWIFSEQLRRHHQVDD